MKQKKHISFIKSRPLRTHLFNILCGNGKYTGSISAAYRVRWLSQAMFLHGTPFLFERMTDKLTNCGYPDLGIRQTLSQQ